MHPFLNLYWNLGILVLHKRTKDIYLICINSESVKKFINKIKRENLLCTLCIELTLFYPKSKDPVNWGLYINVISKSILHLSSISLRFNPNILFGFINLFKD